MSRLIQCSAEGSSQNISPAAAALVYRKIIPIARIVAKIDLVCYVTGYLTSLAADTMVDNPTSLSGSTGHRPPYKGVHVVISDVNMYCGVQFRYRQIIGEVVVESRPRAAYVDNLNLRRAV